MSLNLNIWSFAVLVAVFGLAFSGGRMSKSDTALNGVGKFVYMAVNYLQLTFLGTLALIYTEAMK
jgi:hypothetical protein